MIKKRIGDLLIERGLITQADLESALNAQRETKEKLGEILIKNKIVSPEDMAKTLAVQLNVDYVDLAKVNIPLSLSDYVQKNTAKQNHLVPVQKQEDTLFVAMDDPLNYYALDEVRKVTNLKIVPLISTHVAVERAINTLYGNEGARQAIADYKKEYNAVGDDNPGNFDFVISENSYNIEGEGAPVIRLVNSIIERAVAERASDIHFEPREGDMDVRMRIDGIMREILTVPKDVTPSVIARVKTMSAMDVAEKRVPQDGRFSVSVMNKSIDMRVSTLPIAWGEKIVCRLLDKTNTSIDKEMLGLSPEDMEKYEKLIHYRNGVMLLVGPTGSGKTTTMYAMLNELNTRDVNLVTLEDPVEYNLEGLNQVQINPKINMTFASGLRAILRQDPDIVSIGEIRDGETAEIAMRAALTGRFVMSTIHTNDAVGAIDRLEDIGVEPYLVSATLRGVISQRLVRRICPYCGEEYEPTRDELSRLGIEMEPGMKFKIGKGCQHCFNTGYAGRIAVFEIMMVNPEIRELIYQNAGRRAIEDALHRSPEGFTSLKEAAIKLVKQGITTPYEVLRITNEDA
ncbi:MULTISPECIES: GspE/PulE family protein [unclassified Butyrivibrio]|uniref:GspE/PulE family protein n=1 Tax=unclassified Butyrivibrio TaxID=2639466 RepID=UPI000423F04D|nr:MULTISPECIES: GspE/PulE family protein [unclassified Butyrivibrio]